MAAPNHFKEKSHREVKASISQHKGCVIKTFIQKTPDRRNQQISLKSESTLTSQSAGQGPPRQAGIKGSRPPALSCFLYITFFYHPS